MERYMPMTRQKARKRYACNASEWLENGDLRGFVYDCKPTYAELREIVKARRNKWQILPGQEYLRQVIFHDGSGYNKPYTWRAIPAIHDICVKYDLYD